MYPTASKGAKQDIIFISAVMFFVIGPYLPGFISRIVHEDYSKMGKIELPVTVLLILFVVIVLLCAYYMIITALLYSRGKCTITDKGIKVCFRCPLMKDRFFAWDNIGKVLLAAYSGWKNGLELRCFTVDFQKNVRKWFRRFPPESNLWSDMSFFSMQNKWAVTIQYSPELLEAVKQYHPDIIPYPNEKVVEGFIELQNKTNGA